MLEKTVYIQPFLSQSESSKRWADFVRGFMDSSNWEQAEEANACVNLCSEVSRRSNDFSVVVCPLSRFRSVGIVHENKENLRIDLKIDLASSMVFSKYLDGIQTKEPKYFVNYVWSKRPSSLYGYGYEFGLFAADAINEENWQEYLKNKSKPEREDE